MSGGVELYGPSGTGTDLGRLIDDLGAIVKSIQQGGIVGDGAITDAKVAANAAIAQSKIANLVDALAARADNPTPGTARTAVVTDTDQTVAGTKSIERVYTKSRPIHPNHSYFGAIGDDVLHPLSERYSTLAAAQAAYPGVPIVDRTESIDWAALYLAALAAGSTSDAIDITEKYVINRELPLVAGLTMKGPNYLKAWVRLNGAIRGLVYEPAALTEAGITLEGFRVIGTPTALDLLSFARATNVTLLRMNLRDTSQSSVKLSNECHQFLSESCRFENFAQYGVNATNTVNAGSLLLPDFQANATPGIAAVRLHNSGWWDLIGGNYEGSAQHQHALLLDGASNVGLRHAFLELYTGSPIKAVNQVSRGIGIEHNHISGADSIQADFSGALAHEGIEVVYNRFTGQLEGTNCFHPGATTSFRFVDNGRDPDVGTWVTGYSSKNVVMWPDWIIAHANGLKFGPAGDTNLYRSGPDLLTTDDDFLSALDMQARAGTAQRVIFGARGPGGEAGVQFGLAVDVNLFRLAADILATSDDFELTTIGKAFFARSPDGTRYKLVPPTGGGPAFWVAAP